MIMPSPRLVDGLDRSTPKASVFASYRTAFRAPSESQLFRQGSDNIGKAACFCKRRNL